MTIRAWQRKKNQTVRMVPRGGIEPLRVRHRHEDFQSNHKVCVPSNLTSNLNLDKRAILDGVDQCLITVIHLFGRNRE